MREGRMKLKLYFFFFLEKYEILRVFVFLISNRSVQKKNVNPRSTDKKVFRTLLKL